MAMKNSVLQFVLFASLLVGGLTTPSCDVIRDLTTERPRPTSTEPVPAPGPVPPSTSARELALRQSIVDYAQQFVGTKYQPAGKVPSTGFDCSGFTSYVMKNFQINISSSSRDQALQGAKLDLTKVMPGDLIFFRRSPREDIFHVSLVVANDGKSIKVVHSTTSRGVIIEDVLNSKYWKPYLDSARSVVSLKK